MLSKTQTKSSPKIAIIGGGIAGATAAVHMAELGLDVHLIEKGNGLISGPPICHLHAGGNLYREISTDQCIELLKQSIDTARLYPQTINRRPTVIAVPYSDGGSPEELYERLITIQSCYAELVAEDPANKVLGEPCDYYKFYSREDLEELMEQQQPTKPKSIDDWMIPFAKHTDLDALKFPVVAVEEHGWSVFRIAASATLALEAIPNCTLMTNTQVTGVEERADSWMIECVSQDNEPQILEFDFLVNACGYETGSIDDLANKPRERLVEFKAAYVTKWSECNELWPEVIFHGPRGTPNGMAQLTPYPDGVFQLHGMTKDITLFDDGLVASNQSTSQPHLPLRLKRKIQKGWDEDVIVERSRKAIDHMARYIPDYQQANEYGTPLFGAQQIPGRDDTLRAADVTFEGEHYARVEVVKGSSAYEAAIKLVKEWRLHDYQDNNIESLHPMMMSLSAENIEAKAQQLAVERAYPEQLAKYYGCLS
ncbi:FAD-dependent oxidoreductase [Vibrio europaeus]|uniref:FAD-dependent oxidoreductase n=1 Tax=Vibrio europaeus TaxID=300876 RepID=UPI00233EB678|nr:FAD-dependent oxidoreductase [Vibrio europaeus]MDC5855808.1 FAD-dependent oxidoreductase [Vibrio europaeus]